MLYLQLEIDTLQKLQKIGSNIYKYFIKLSIVAMRIWNDKTLYFNKYRSLRILQYKKSECIMTRTEMTPELQQSSRRDGVFLFSLKPEKLVLRKGGSWDAIVAILSFPSAHLTRQFALECSINTDLLKSTSLAKNTHLERHASKRELRTIICFLIRRQCALCRVYPGWRLSDAGE